MRNITLEVNEQNFNLLWRSIVDREQKLLQIIKDNENDNENDNESEAGPMASNDLMYLRLYKKTLEDKAKESGFSESSFSSSDEIIDLSKL